MTVDAAGEAVDMTMMYALHDAFRRDIGRLAAAAARHRHADRAGQAAVQAGWELFSHNLHHHHTVEDTQLWPLTRRHLQNNPDALAVLDAMEAEHALIDPAFDRINAALHDRETGHERLGDAVDHLATVLNQHLGHEEREAIPLICRTISAAEWHAFGKKHQRDTGLKVAAQFFPWLLDGARPDRADHVLGQLPPPLRWIYRHRWNPRYARTRRWS